MEQLTFNDFPLEIKELILLQVEPKDMLLVCKEWKRLTYALHIKFLINKYIQKPERAKIVQKMIEISKYENRRNKIISLALRLSSSEPRECRCDVKFNETTVVIKFYGTGPEILVYVFDYKQLEFVRAYIKEIYEKVKYKTVYGCQSWVDVFYSYDCVGEEITHKTKIGKRILKIAWKIWKSKL